MASINVITTYVGLMRLHKVRELIDTHPGSILLSDLSEYYVAKGTCVTMMPRDISVYYGALSMSPPHI